jgi:hypothetical protein
LTSKKRGRDNALGSGGAVNARGCLHGGGQWFESPQLDGTIHEIGLGAMQMADKGFSRGWGLGRHVLGSSYFHYVRDPWGSYAEYSCDMDFIPADVDWQGGDHDAR